MTHGFALHLGQAGQLAQPRAALARMTDRGWATAAPGADAIMAVSGLAEISRAGSLHLCGMARLDDRAPLVAQLNLTQTEAQALSDLALLARLRAAEGPEFAADLPGAFSFVILDLDRGCVEGWRDPFGLYPFFHTLHDGALTVSSDPRVCLHLSQRPLEPDPSRIADFVRGTEGDVSRTALSGLLRLPAAHRLESDGKTVRTTRYWQLALPAPQPSDGAPERLRAALRTATQAQMRSCPGPVGAMLSGGLDSTALAGLAAETAGTTPLRSLSFVYGADKPHDESLYISAAEQAFGTVPHRIAVTGPPVLADMGPMIEEQVDLFLAPGLQKSRRLYTEARALGLGAVIDGHGGDEVISHGYGRLIELAAQRRFAALYRETRGVARVHGTPFWGLYLSHVAQHGGLRRGHPLRRVLMWLARRQIGTASGAGDPGLSLVAPKQRARIETDIAAEAPRPPIDPHNAESAAHLANLENPVLIQSFEVLFRSATAAGILPLYPFFDRRVVTLCLALGSDTKLRDGRTRWILREAMRGLMPELVRTRPDKAEFGSELAEAVRVYWQDRPIETAPGLGDHVDIAAAAALRDAVLSGARHDAHALRALWRLVVLQHWLAAFEGWRSAQAEGRLV